MKRKNMTKFDKAVSAAFTGHRFYGGMETDATISDETDKMIGLNSFVYYYG